MSKSMHILADVAQETGVTPEDLRGSKRTHDIARARFIAIYAIRQALGLSYNQIRRVFDYKHHTSIMYAIARVESAPDLKATAMRIIERQAA